jgi:hypothetical protein
MDIIPISIIFILIVTLSLVVWSDLFCKRFVWIIFFGFIARIFLIYIHENLRVFGDFDINDYHGYLIDFSRLDKSEILSFIKPHSPFYIVLYPGWVYNIFGEEGLWIIRLFNAAIGSTIVAPMSKINKLIFNKDLYTSQALIISFWPTWMRYNIEIGRTSISVLFVIIGIMMLLTLSRRYKGKKYYSYIFCTILILFFSATLRLHYAVYFLPALAFLIMNQINQIKTSSYLGPIVYFISTLLTLFLVTTILFVYQNITQHTYGISAENSLEAVMSLSEEGEQGNSGYLQGVFPGHPWDLSWYLPLSFFYFMFSPMPWDIHSTFAAGSSLQAIIVFISCLIVVKNWRKIISAKIKVKMFTLLVIIIVLPCIFFGFGVKNAGSAERWRLPSTLLSTMLCTSAFKLLKVENMKTQVPFYKV